MRRKQNRLNPENYKSPHIYYLTLNCFDRSKHFLNSLTVQDCVSELVKLSKKYNAKIWAYCFMPDHLHLLLDTEDCIKFMKDFKQITGYQFKKKTGRALWQKSYYDHILRKQEDLIGTIKYILNNPVRAGLAGHYLDHSYSGSFEIDIKDFMET